MTIDNLKNLYIVDTDSFTCFPVTVPMLLNFTGIKETIRSEILDECEKHFDDEQREELLEEIKNDFLKDVQNGLDDKETEIDGLTDEAEDFARSIQSDLNSLRDKLQEIVNNTASDAEDYI